MRPSLVILSQVNRDIDCVSPPSLLSAKSNLWVEFKIFTKITDTQNSVNVNS